LPGILEDADAELSGALRMLLAQLRLEVEWWRRLDALGLADGSLKERFLGRDRSPASIRQYAKFRRKMVFGERYRTDA
jgi:hypothetical protein